MIDLSDSGSTQRGVVQSAPANDRRVFWPTAANVGSASRWCVAARFGAGRLASKSHRATEAFAHRDCLSVAHCLQPGIDNDWSQFPPAQSLAADPTRTTFALPSPPRAAAAYQRAATAQCS